MKKGEMVFNWILVVLAVLFVIAAVQITPFSKMTASSEGFYPTLIAFFSLFLAIGNIIKAYSDRRKLRKANQKSDDSDGPTVFNKDVMVMMGLCILYIILIFTIHYILATLVFACLSILYLTGRQWKTSLMIGFISTMMIVLVFKYIFSVILP